MKFESKYDPEDIESLLLHKQFNELYPEEKEFVLRHLENEQEYESMRSVLMELKNISTTDEWLEPDASIKKNLMREFSSEKKSRFVIWLNSLFAFPDRPWYSQRGVQIAFGVFILGFLLFRYAGDNQPSSQFAENVKPANENRVDSTSSESAAALAEKPAVDTSNKNLAIPKAPQVFAALAPTKDNAEPTVAVNSESRAKMSEIESSDEVVLDHVREEVTYAAPPSDDSKSDLSSAEVFSNTNSNTNPSSTSFSSTSVNQLNETAFYTTQATSPISDYSDLMNSLFTAR
jgi:hypothetical protein